MNQRMIYAQYCNSQFSEYLQQFLYFLEWTDESDSERVPVKQLTLKGYGRSHNSTPIDDNSPYFNDAAVFQQKNVDNHPGNNFSSLPKQGENYTSTNHSMLGASVEHSQSNKTYSSDYLSSGNNMYTGGNRSTVISNPYIEKKRFKGPKTQTRSEQSDAIRKYFIYDGDKLTKIPKNKLSFFIRKMLGIGLKSITKNGGKVSQIKKLSICVCMRGLPLTTLIDTFVLGKDQKVFKVLQI